MAQKATLTSPGFSFFASSVGKKFINDNANIALFSHKMHVITWVTGGILLEHAKVSRSSLEQLAPPFITTTNIRQIKKVWCLGSKYSYTTRAPREWRSKFGQGSLLSPYFGWISDLDSTSALWSRWSHKFNKLFLVSLQSYPENCTNFCSCVE